MANDRVRRLLGFLKSRDVQNGFDSSPTQRARPRVDFTWSDLKRNIKLIAIRNGSSLSANELVMPDLVGHYDQELYLRWLQAVCLIPDFRKELYAQQLTHYSVAQVLELRHCFEPFIKAVVASSRDYKWPIVRSIEKIEPDNAKVRGIDDCYLLGHSLYVAPVVSPQTTQRYVYLPTGQWYYFWTNQLFSGSQYVKVDAAIGTLPLFIRAGTVLPLNTLIDDSDDENAAILIYRIYPGEHETVLYEDDTHAFEEERHDYRWIYISASWDGDKLVIKRRVAGQYQPSYNQIRIEVVGFDQQPYAVRIDHRPAPLWFVDDGVLEFTTDAFQIIEIAMSGEG